MLLEHPMGEGPVKQEETEREQLGLNPTSAIESPEQTEETEREALARMHTGIFFRQGYARNVL